jgi:predicted esterase
MKKSQLHKQFIPTVLILCSLFFVSCSKKGSDSPVESAPQSRGQVLSTSFFASYSASSLQTLFNASVGTSQSGIVLQYDVDVYKVVYVTIDPKGNLVQASGALYIPKGRSNLSLISFHHGTMTQRTEAPSANPLNTSEGLLSAALGYFALEPDYLGFGESNILHPYLYQKSSALTVIDFIRAGRSVASAKRVTLNSQVFLAGYSEGGYVTLAAQKEIEKNYRGEINITASAPMAGSYDLNLTANAILQNKTYNEPGYLAFIFLVYNNIYGWNRLNDIFMVSYSQLIPPLFDGTKNLGQINAFLTTDLTKLFNQSFVASFQSGKETAITDAFTANSLLDWTPTSPTRLFHGDADELVPYQNSVEARDYFNSHGAKIDLVTIAGGTHETSALPSIIAALNWFGSLRLSTSLAFR